MSNYAGMKGPKEVSLKKLHLGGPDQVTKAEYKLAKRTAAERRKAGEGGVTWRDALDALRAEARA